MTDVSVKATDTLKCEHPLRLPAGRQSAGGRRSAREAAGKERRRSGEEGGTRVGPRKVVYTTFDGLHALRENNPENLTSTLKSHMQHRSRQSSDWGTSSGYDIDLGIAIANIINQIAEPLGPGYRLRTQRKRINRPNSRPAAVAGVRPPGTPAG